jgi:hypothetical protein
MKQYGILVGNSLYADISILSARKMNCFCELIFKQTNLNISMIRIDSLLSTVLFKCKERINEKCEYMYHELMMVMYVTWNINIWKAIEI